ncbi:MAG: class B sortase [Lachnospiraceae bacterium]|nr:class B sortase [Lachnospiraceae bacterium]
MKKLTKNQIQIILILLCTLIFLGCAIWLILYMKGSSATTKQTESLMDSYVKVEQLPVDPEDGTDDKHGVEVKPIPVEKEKVTIDGREYDTFEGLSVPRRTIDFEAIQTNENMDIYAWIYVPGTEVDYPVLQHPNNDAYYLDHDMKGKKAACGSIYTEKANSRDFNDNHTVLYGHNMKNGTMFKTLRYYDDKEFFDNNKYIYVYTAKDTRVYEIFGAYEYDDRHLLKNFATENAGEYQKYLESVKKLSDACGHFDRDMSLYSSDKIITLSTCIANKPESRYLVQGKLIAVEEN